MISRSLERIFFRANNYGTPSVIDGERAHVDAWRLIVVMVMPSLSRLVPPQVRVGGQSRFFSLNGMVVVIKNRGRALVKLLLDADAGVNSSDVVGTSQQRVDVHLLDLGRVVEHGREAHDDFHIGGLVKPLLAAGALDDLVPLQ